MNQEKNQRKVVESGNWCTKVCYFSAASHKNKKVFFLKEDKMA